eukprot:m.436215 g.436215  ORF g.436215 m.436215 type:complete len:148 (-) comp17950_c0_seq1:118-561(-)
MALRASPVVRGFLNDTQHSLPRWARALLTVSPDETPWTRYTKDMSSRSPPPPMLAGVGVAHKISENHYYTRDVKRAVRPVFIVGNTANTPLTIAAPAEGEVGPSESTIQNASLKSGPVFTGRRVKWSAGEPTPRMGESAYDDYGGLR